MEPVTGADRWSASPGRRHPTAIHRVFLSRKLIRAALNGHHSICRSSAGVPQVIPDESTRLMRSRKAARVSPLHLLPLLLLLVALPTRAQKQGSSAPNPWPPIGGTRGSATSGATVNFGDL